MSISTHYRQVLQSVHEKAQSCGRSPSEITLIAVSKGYPIESIESVYREGGKVFGESRVQEALDKIPSLSADCQWHFIGTLQSNKVIKVICHFQLIHAVDTPLLAQKISQMSQEKGVITPILLQVNTSGEKTKHGLAAEDWYHSLEGINQLTHLKIEGLMTMAPFTEDQQVIHTCFRKLYELRERWRKEMREPALFQQLSMGMSHDYLIAIEEGATLLRVGTAIFSA